MSTQDRPSAADAGSFPAGFGPWRHDSPFLRRLGPIAESTEDGRIVGFRVADQLTNARGALHGGALAAIVDVVMGHATAELAVPAPSLVTVSLTLNLTTTARLGEWVRVSALPRRLGRRLAFADATVESDARLLATASGIFAITREGHGP